VDEVYAALARVPLFGNIRRDGIEIERLEGALTNVCYKVTVGRSSYVLRLAGEGTSGYIDRSAEEHNALVAAAAGVGAEVVYFDAGDGMMLTRFVEGTSVNARGGFGPGAPARAARTLARVHGLGEVFTSRFDVFAAIDRYLDLLREQGTRLPEGYGEARRGARAARLALEASPAPLVPCHNDPWPGNLLDAGGRVYLIDWEYSGMNDAVWDLADLSVEAGFGPGQDREMMEAYYEDIPSPALYSRLEVYKAMGDLHWSLWGFVRHGSENPARDLWGYGLERLGRANARMGSAEFGWHLGLVRGAPSVVSRKGEHGPRPRRIGPAYPRSSS